MTAVIAAPVRFSVPLLTWWSLFWPPPSLCGVKDPTAGWLISWLNGTCGHGIAGGSFVVESWVWPGAFHILNHTEVLVVHTKYW